MLRERMDEYLDGALSASDRAEVEASAARDSKAAKMLAAVRSERALRTAAYNSYMPTNHEARSLAEQVMAEARHAPVGRIDYWVRRGLAVAAGLAIVVGAFMAGQTFSPTKQVQVATDQKTVYDVVYMDGSGTVTQTICNSLEERNELITDLQQKGSTILAADFSPPGHM